MSMPVLYMKLERDFRSEHEDVYVKDCASVYCEDKLLQAKAVNVKLHHFQKDKPLLVMDVTYIIRNITNAIPGVQINSLGETDVILECTKFQTAKNRQMLKKREKEENKENNTQDKKSKKIHTEKKNMQRRIQITVVAFISFIGSMYTIMAYHNDVGIRQIFARTCKIVMGNEKEGILVLEIAYSIGLGLGIIYFYNHIWNRRLTKDPTPIEVEMKQYERDVDSAIVDNADREGMEIDVDS